MTQINFNIDDKRLKRFQDAIYKRKGMKRGNIKEAIIEAIDLWIDNHD